MSLRKIIFWGHLIAGVAAGAVIGIMCFSGVTLAFEKEIIAWADKDAWKVAPAEKDAKPLTLDEMLARAREAQPGVRPTGVVISADPSVAVMVNLGRTNACYVNPYSGEVHAQGAAGTRDFLRAMNEWHRWLARQGDSRQNGKAVTGAGNAVFLALAISGVYLWWPRAWTKNVLRAIAIPSLKLAGKRRDWNWHNAIGIWSAPVLVVITATALPMSYRAVNDMIYKMTGNEPPPAPSGPGGGNTGQVVDVPVPPSGAKPLKYEALFAATREQAPAWEQITFRLGGGGGGRQREGGERSGREQSGGEERKPGPQAVTVIVKARAAWPRFATAQLSLDPFTGAVLRREAFGNYNLGRKIRSWSRFLHTGEAFGWFGQTITALASAGGLVLVVTGFALAVRRLLGFGKKSRGATAQVANEEAVETTEVPA